MEHYVPYLYYIVFLLFVNGFRKQWIQIDSNKDFAAYYSFEEFFVWVLGDHPLARAFVLNKCYTCRVCDIFLHYLIFGKTCLTVRHISGFKLRVLARRLEQLMDRSLGMILSVSFYQSYWGISFWLFDVNGFNLQTSVKRKSGSLIWHKIATRRSDPACPDPAFFARSGRSAPAPPAAFRR